jgi:hypothetical protein
VFKGQCRYQLSLWGGLAVFVAVAERAAAEQQQQQQQQYPSSIQVGIIKVTTGTATGSATGSAFLVALAVVF